MSARASDRVADPRALAVLTFALLGVSLSGPLVRLSHAHPLAIAAWRLGVLPRRRRRRAARHRPVAAVAPAHWRETAIAAGAGSMLALHFWSWNTSVGLTSVAASVVLVNTQPVVVALLSAFWLREAPSRRQWLGIAVAMLGALVVALPDLLATQASATRPRAAAGRSPRARRRGHRRDLLRRRTTTARRRSISGRTSASSTAPASSRCSLLALLTSRAARCHQPPRRARDLRRPRARPDAARPHGTQLGAQAVARVRRESHAARGAGRRDADRGVAPRHSRGARARSRSSAARSCSPECSSPRAG